MFTDSFANDLLSGLIILYVFPFVVGFFLALALSFYIFSEKNNRFHIKSLAPRFLISFILSVVVGVVGTFSFVLSLIALHSMGLNIPFHLFG